MPNLRIIYENAADRATIVASSQAGTLGPAWLKTDIKAEVWRSTGTSATLTATFATAALISGVALPFCNLTSDATIRVRGYAEVSDAAPLFDTGVVRACAHQPLGVWGWGTEPLGVNAFAFGGASYGRCWCSPGWVKKLVIDVADPLNLVGYIEASRLVAGAYWSPESNPDYGASVTADDASEQYRSDAGDLLTNIGPRSRKLSMNLSYMPGPDRAKLMQIIRGNGKSRPVFISLFPEDRDPILEQDHQLYGKLPDAGPVSAAIFDRYSASITVEEI